MAAQEHKGGGSPSESQTNVEHSFDELARALAEGTISRRGALKLFAGTAIAALIPSRALADDDCVRVCHVPFNREKRECDVTNAVTRCVSRRERRRHLDEHRCDCRGSCRNCLTPECLPFGEPCTVNGQCCDGRCASSGPEQPRVCNDPCPDGRVPLSNGTCAVPCTSVADCTVPPGGTETNCEGGCAAEAITGQGFCAGAVQGTPCVRTLECPEGEFCVAGACVTRCNPEPV